MNADPKIIHLPLPESGLLVVEYAKPEPHGRVFSGKDYAKEAKAYVHQRMSAASAPLRVFALVEMFSVAGAVLRRCPDDWAYAIEAMVREQVSGKGMTDRARGAPSGKANEVIQEIGKSSEVNYAPDT